MFSKLQALLGDRLASEIMPITMTLDPVTDIPARMRSRAGRFQANPGSVYPTGEKPAMDSVRKGLGAYFPDFREHPPMVLAGDGKTGSWKRVTGLVSVWRLLSRLDELESMRSEWR